MTLLRNKLTDLLRSSEFLTSRLCRGSYPQFLDEIPTRITLQTDPERLVKYTEKIFRLLAPSVRIATSYPDIAPGLVWCMLQVYLGPEVSVRVTGQRAMAMLSRSSLVLNTSVIAEPGTLGGFPGGGGIARVPGSLLDPPIAPPEHPVGALANGTLVEGVPSYNINGPGSASYRYYLFTVTTSADDIDGVQQAREHPIRRHRMRHLG